jgi:hypothetical protein
MRPATLIAMVVGCGVAIGIVWLLLGSRIALAVDRCFPGQPSSQPANPLAIQADRFILGSRSWPLPRRGAFELKIVTDAHGRLVLSAGGRPFTLGPVQRMWADPAGPQYEFLPEAGDTVSFTRNAGRLCWPAPFAFSIMGAPVARWHRHAYDRLRWTKGSGARLEMTWRDDQGFYPGSGWADAYTNRLTDIGIHPGPVAEAVAAYLAATRGWTGGEYRLETQSTPGEDSVVTAIYLEDERASQPGAGKSVVLRVDKRSGKVSGETGFQ